MWLKCMTLKREKPTLLSASRGPEGKADSATTMKHISLLGSGGDVFLSPESCVSCPRCALRKLIGPFDQSLSRQCLRRNYLSFRNLARLSPNIRPRKLEMILIVQYPRFSPTSFTWIRPLILWPSIVLQILQNRAGVLQSTQIPFSAQGVLMPIRMAFTGAA